MKPEIACLMDQLHAEIESSRRATWEDIDMLRDRYASREAPTPAPRKVNRCVVGRFHPEPKQPKPAPSPAQSNQPSIEMSFIRWREQQAERLGIPTHTFEMRLYRGIYPMPPMRRVNARVVYVKL